MSTANPNRERALELKAGLFVIIGLVFIAVMAFKFGRLGQGLFQSYYQVTVDFPSADGIIKNSDVQLAGARIGYVSDKPVIAPGGSGVTIPLQILSSVKIPRQTTFEISSSGLLGDKFVEIKPSVKFNAAAFDPSDASQVIESGSTIQGQAAGGDLGTLQTKGEQVFDELKVEIEKLTEVTNKINTGILSAQNQANITETFANLKDTSEHFNLATKDLEAVVNNGNDAINSAKTTLATINTSAADARTVIDGANKALASAQSALDTARDVLARAQTGNGPVATLLNNRELSDNLKALVENLREHGILFYKNRPADGSASPAPRPAH